MQFRPGNSSSNPIFLGPFFRCVCHADQQFVTKTIQKACFPIFGLRLSRIPIATRGRWSWAKRQSDPLLCGRSNIPLHINIWVSENGIENNLWYTIIHAIPLTVYPHGISLGYIIIILAANEVHSIPGTLICDHRNDDKNRIQPVNGRVPSRENHWNCDVKAPESDSLFAMCLKSDMLLYMYVCI